MPVPAPMILFWRMTHPQVERLVEIPSVCCEAPWPTRVFPWITMSYVRFDAPLALMPKAPSIPKLSMVKFSRAKKLEFTISTVLVPGTFWITAGDPEDGPVITMHCEELPRRPEMYKPG